MGKVVLMKKQKKQSENNSLEIAYDDGYIKLTKKDFPITFGLVSKKNLSENSEENLNGELINVRSIPTRLRGGNATLSEIIFKKEDYNEICKELNVSKLPVLFRAKDRMLIMIVSEK